MRVQFASKVNLREDIQEVLQAHQSGSSANTLCGDAAGSSISKAACEPGCCLCDLLAARTLRLYRARAMPAIAPALSGVTELCFEHCAWLTHDQLPQAASGWPKHLCKLAFHHCKVLQRLPTSVWQLPKLQCLSLCSCPALTSVADSAPVARGAPVAQLRSLHIDACRSLQRIEPAHHGIANASPCKLIANVEALRVTGCSKLQGVHQHLSAMTGLQHLCLRDCAPRWHPIGNALPRLSALASLALPEAAIPELVQHAASKQVGDPLNRLRRLCLHGTQSSSCDILPKQLSQLSRLALTALHFADFSHLQELPSSLQCLSRLQELALVRCAALQDLPASFATALTQLSCVHLQGCPQLRPPDMLCDETSSRVRCKVHVHDCRFISKGDLTTDESTAPLAEALLKSRQHAIQSLLQDRDAQRSTMDSIAIVAVLLATAAFVAFAQSPSVAGLFEGHFWANNEYNEMQLTREDRSTFLRLFFAADQATFVLSMTVVMLYLVGSLPRCCSTNHFLEAARIWTGLLIVSTLLGASVACGVTAFWLGAIAVYPWAWAFTDVLPFVLFGALAGLLICAKWAVALLRLWPGRPALQVRPGLPSAGSPRLCCMPLLPEHDIAMCQLAK